MAATLYCVQAAARTAPDAICLHSLFLRLLKGKLGKRSGHLLITCSFLFFDLWKEPRRYTRYCVIKRSERCAWTGDEKSLVVPCLQVS